jgi:pyruvate kinase
MARRTRIVCTMGPSTRDPKVLDRLISGGMDVARLNMSHGTHAEHAACVKALRAAALRAGKHLAILQDLQGPKIRVGKMVGGAVALKPGARLRIVTDEVEGNAERISTSYAALAKDCRKGDPILLDDGKLRLRVLSSAKGEVLAQVEVGGSLKDHKGMNLPGVALSTPSVTRKDYDDLAFGLALGVDYVALSFVRQPSDVEKVRAFIRRRGRTTPVIAKIEKPEAVERLDAIVAVADGVMVARGDLGVELDLAEVPRIQKTLIALANRHKALVITATQMLESMTEEATPTRAEVSDVANAILDGTDAVMLSGETAAGKHPVEACAMMAHICETTEASPAYADALRHRWADHAQRQRDPEEALSFAARALSEDLKLAAVLCLTLSGRTARFTAAFRPGLPVYAFSPDAGTLTRMGLYWGVRAYRIGGKGSLDSLISQACRNLKKEKKVRIGDRVAVVVGRALSRDGAGDLVKIHTVE